jgi:5-methylcytosine-specific restriction endonuclease McrA
MTMRTLILTAEMRPHGVAAWQDAVTLLFNGKVRVLSTFDEIIGRVRFDQIEDFEHFLEDLPSSAYDGDMIILRTPSVLALKKEIGGGRRAVKFSRENVLFRDKFRCQYCGKSGEFESLNYDHVIPRCRGGKTSWENIVAACYPCNTSKANRTPEEAGMRLLQRPVKPRTLPLKVLRIHAKHMHPDWAHYLGEGV